MGDTRGVPKELIVQAGDVRVEGIVILNIHHGVAGLRRALKPSIATQILAGLDHARVWLRELEADTGVIVPNQNLANAFDPAESSNDYRQVLRTLPGQQAGGDAGRMRHAYR